MVLLLWRSSVVWATSAQVFMRWYGVTMSLPHWQVYMFPLKSWYGHPEVALS